MNEMKTCPEWLGVEEIHEGFDDKTRSRLLKQIDHMRKNDLHLISAPKTKSHQSIAANAKKHLDAAETHIRQGNDNRARYHMTMYGLNQRRGNMQ